MSVSKSNAGKGFSPNQATSVDDQEGSGVRVLKLAEYFVDSGRVIPGIARQLDGRFRSWWWPLPSALERDSVRSIVASNTFEGHQQAANELSEAVDTLIRSRLLGSTPKSSHEAVSKFAGSKTPPALLGLLPKKKGRRCVAEAWVHSLVSADPFLPSNLDEQTVAAFVDSIELWVRSGLPYRPAPEYS
jgi:hypothetical protein